MKAISNSTMVIKYPNGAKQVVKPGPGFNGDWDGLAKSIAGNWYRDNRGEVGKIPFELR